MRRHYDIPIFRVFRQPDPSQVRAPDAMPLLHFSHLLEAHRLGTALLTKVGELLLANGVKLSGGTIVDASHAK